MGAFGELMIKHMGGNLEHYRGNTGKKAVSKPNGETSEEIIQYNLEKKQKGIELALEPLLTSIIYGRFSADTVDVDRFKCPEHKEFFINWRREYNK